MSDVSMEEKIDYKKDILHVDQRIGVADQWWRTAVRPELVKATQRYGSFSSAHEGYAVILEELDEMWDEIKKNNTTRSKEECIQVAAMAIRFLVDVK